MISLFFLLLCFEFHLIMIICPSLLPQSLLTLLGHRSIYGVSLMTWLCFNKCKVQEQQNEINLDPLIQIQK